MKINQLKLENFRNHTRTELVLDRINFFVGRNNSGKSSILAAIEYGFTGRCLWTDRAGRGVADLVRRGEKKAMVAMTFIAGDVATHTAGDGQTLAARESMTRAGGVNQTLAAGDLHNRASGDGQNHAREDSLVRTLVPHSLQFGRLSGVNEAQTAIYNKLNTDEENLRLALNATYFLSLTPTEQKAFLFSAGGLVFTPQIIAEALQQWLIIQGQDADTATRLAQKAYRYSPLDRTGGSEIIEAMERLARDDRKIIKRDKQKVVKALEEISDSQNPHYDAAKLEAVEENLQELRARRDQTLQALGSSQAEQNRRQNLLAQKERLVDEFNRTQRRIRELKTRLTELSRPSEFSEEPEQPAGKPGQSLEQEVEPEQELEQTLQLELELELELE